MCATCFGLPGVICGKTGVFMKCPDCLGRMRVANDQGRYEAILRQLARVIEQHSDQGADVIEREVLVTLQRDGLLD